MKHFSLLLFLLFSLNSLYAQKPVEKGMDSLLIYEELFLDNLESENTEKAIYYGEKWKGQHDKLELENDSVYCLLVGFLSKAHYLLGDIKESVSLLDELLPIKKTVYGEESKSYASSLNDLACYICELGDFPEAIRLGTEALNIERKVIGHESLEYSTYLNNLARFNFELGNYEEAIRLGKNALDLRAKLTGQRSLFYARSLSNLASYYSELSNHSVAIRLGMEALEIYRESPDPDYFEYATLINNLGEYFSELGNYDEAIRLCHESLDLQEESFGTDNPYYAVSLCNLASYYASLGSYSEAVNLCNDAVDILRNFDTVHPYYATALSNLANYKSDLGLFKEAILIGKEAMEIKKKVYGSEHLDYAVSLSNLASYYSSLGNYQEALRLGLNVLEIQKKVLDTEHPKYSNSLSNLASYYSDLKNYQEAYNLENQSTDITRDYILNSFSELSSNLQESLWNDKYVHSFNLFFPSIVYQHQTMESISELYDKTALFAKGILLNSSVGMRKLILESGDSELISKYDVLSANKSIYEKQLEKPINERFLNVDSLRALIQQQEMELARDSKAYGDFARNLRINWKDVQQKLDKNDIAIEFLDFPVLNTDSVMYVALTLKKGYDSPHMIPLFEKKQLDAISQRNYYIQTSLYDMVWKPLTEELKGVRDIYFSPSGSLHRIGIEYVPVSEAENICDQYRLHRLSSTRQLAFNQDETSGKESVLYGGLVYDAQPSETDKLVDNRSFAYMNRADVDSLSLRGSYEYLPGTKDEADHIASYLKKYGHSYVYHSGAKGTEESFKQLDGSRPKTLHIATHGFYMTQQDAEINRHTSQIRVKNDGPEYVEDKPMTRSGLLLSGCGPALKHEPIPDGVEDGILTAQEISKLDLRGLDLVVLSACQTGLGDIISGEGVFGLQRGFKNAGARTIIMSLWKVSDSATQQLMSSFYSHYLQGKGKEESFRLAQSELRKEVSSNPSKPDWAAFVLLDGLK
ncbi:MAG: CHAT domain-containing protein [Bacteroidaceae bacterium]|nr:CHAT domain-containing protein [Bacteroidaceae bacterium]